jgi:hypothetical protein
MSTFEVNVSKVDKVINPEYLEQEDRTEFK